MHEFEPDQKIIHQGLLGNALATQHDLHGVDLNTTRHRVLIGIPTEYGGTRIDTDTPVSIGIGIIQPDDHLDTDNMWDKPHNVIRYTDDAVKNLRVVRYNRRNNKWQ